MIFVCCSSGHMRRAAHEGTVKRSPRPVRKSTSMWKSYRRPQRNTAVERAIALPSSTLRRSRTISYHNARHEHMDRVDLGGGRVDQPTRAGATRRSVEFVSILRRRRRLLPRGPTTSPREPVAVRQASLATAGAARSYRFSPSLASSVHCRRGAVQDRGIHTPGLICAAHI